MTEHDRVLGRLIPFAAAMAIAFILALAALLITTPGAQAATEPKAHTSYIAGVTVCGFWANQKVYVPCRWAYLQRRVREMRNIRSAEPLRKDFKGIRTSIGTSGDYGPNSWFTKFKFTYNQAGARWRVRTCKGYLIVNARNGKNIRISHKSGNGC